AVVAADAALRPELRPEVSRQKEFAEVELSRAVQVARRLPVASECVRVAGRDPKRCTTADAQQVIVRLPAAHAPVEPDVVQSGLCIRDATSADLLALRISAGDLIPR